MKLSAKQISEIRAKPKQAAKLNASKEEKARCKEEKARRKEEAKIEKALRIEKKKHLLMACAKKLYADTKFVMREDTRRVFIDCGYRYGLATEFFKKTHPESEKFEYFAFEGNATLECPDSVIRKAVWIDDCELDFYLGGEKKGEDMGGGSTLIAEKKSGNLDKENPIKVECIDFSKWLRSKFSKTDYIIVKFNIEGSEYPVINHMFKCHTTSMVNAFYISWHWRKLKGMTEDDHLQSEKIVPHFAWDLSYDANGNIDDDGYREYFVDSLEKWD